MTSTQKDFQIGSKTDWRKRQQAITRYIEELEYRLSLAIAANTEKQITIDRFTAILAEHKEAHK